MKKIFKSIALASLGLAILFSCTKNEPVVGTADGNGQMKLSVTGVLGEYKAAEGTKASLVNNIRVGWEKDEQKKDTVLVFHKEGQKYLGYLVATVRNNDDDRTATLSGTITAPEGDNKTLVFVHGTGLNPSGFTVGDVTASVTLDLSSQNEKTPFMVYGTAPYIEENVKDIIVDFSFATSVVSTYAAGLPANTAVTKATLGDINTKCVLTIPTSGDITVSGNNLGVITKTAGIGNTNDKGQVLFEIAVPVSEAASSGRSVEFTIDSETYTTAFSNEAIEAGKAYSAMSENHSVEAVVLGKASTTIFTGATEMLTATVYPKKSTQAVDWTSSNEAIATVDNDGKVTGVALGTATITATSKDDSSITATCTVTVDDHEYVVIRGLKWATCNIGAGNPSDKGWYFSWGNTEGYVHNGTNWVKASDGSKTLGTDGSFSSTNYSSTPGHSLSTDIYPASVNDAARINWGGDWRMPTKDEFDAMKKATYWAWDGTSKGYYVFKPGQGTKGKADGRGNISTSSDTTSLALLFFPAAGLGDVTDLDDAGDYGYYWSSSLYSDNTDYAYYLGFESNGVYPQNNDDRYNGFPVRPVSDK